MSASIRKKKKKRISTYNQNKITMLIIIFVVCVLMATLLVKTNHLNAKLKESQEKVSKLDQQIEDENQRTEDIETMEEYMHSDEYLKQVAKEKLGLVEDGEVLFKEE